MNIFLLLTIMVIGGFIFISLPNGRNDEGVHQNSSLTIRKNLTKELKAIIIFVSDRKQTQPIESLLAYKVLAQLEVGSRNSPKHVWLLHSDPSSGDGSSYASAIQICRKFRSERIRISAHAVDDIFDASAVFLIVREILSSKKLGVSTNEIVCDCTSGTKLVTLGVALASFGSSRIVYFPPKMSGEPADEYAEIDASVFFQSLMIKS